MKQMNKDNFKLPQVWAFEIYKTLYLVICFLVLYNKNRNCGEFFWLN